ncbi:DUF5957 family protein [Paenibacillus timonensis]|uniref:DUF5957 family protein n=1 Tax=Paenibacillus timonensis TaxID=225915 RepID=A0ABW3S985_9BACL|nr:MULTISPECIES: DUF5957 family protein [Paenibacillus]MCH1639282.1 DUF5957 family protein [Paenibacillus timonensis]MDU2238973.1 DUF5957 family protein [Paenibacillus sp.]GJM80244.1 hypothetical protein HMSSN139_27400 [Paenibacillus sp. HMSSN-139]
MKKALWFIAALVGGLIGGLVLSEWIAVSAVALLRGDLSWLRGIKYLPLVTAALAGILVLKRNSRRRNR